MSKGNTRAGVAAYAQANDFAMVGTHEMRVLRDERWFTKRNTLARWVQYENGQGKHGDAGTYLVPVALMTAIRVIRQVFPGKTCKSFPDSFRSRGDAGRVPRGHRACS